MLNARTSSVEQTAQLAAAISQLVTPGDLILLSGDLGAGKTTFTKGFGAALGVSEPITSPTFTLVREYQGRLKLYHLDVYRIEQIEEALDLGLAELLDEGAVTLIEWAQNIANELPADHLEISIELGDGDDDRLYRFALTGARWAARAAALAASLAPWNDASASADR
ncbi:MAG: tRNA (adenosine(37)-N6)-threonylcarbamoyltransferase complex ATPase subunit type 1 TsaE [Actinobacteria bacterium]|nr:tRNA (adenosine(37)-N6)-threonylcarbamoyltransferase complex ATPase subunit type 1 TsaE [Actinomycetota bacterium]